jgi:hypothetical protein
MWTCTCSLLSIATWGHGNGGRAPRFLNLATRWRRTSRPRPLTPQRQSCWLGPMKAPVLAGNRSTQPLWLLCLPFCIISLHVLACIVTRLRAGQPRYRGLIPGRKMTFVSSPKRPDRLWGSPSLLFNECRAWG